MDTTRGLFYYETTGNNMIKKHYYSWQDVERMCVDICTQMHKDRWIPDYIVGITRGGNVPATIISNILNVRGEALKVSLRDNKNDESCETNCWMAEDAFAGKNILVVDDINDTGATFNWIVQDWESSTFDPDDIWHDVWRTNVRFATLTENLSSEFDNVKYYAHEINKAEEDVWLVYPWENVGKY